MQAEITLSPNLQTLLERARKNAPDPEKFEAFSKDLERSAPAQACLRCTLAGWQVEHYYPPNHKLPADSGPRTARTGEWLLRLSACRAHVALPISDDDAYSLNSYYFCSEEKQENGEEVGGTVPHSGQAVSGVAWAKAQAQAQAQAQAKTKLADIPRH